MKKYLIASNYDNIEEGVIRVFRSIEITEDEFVSLKTGLGNGVAAHHDNQLLDKLSRLEEE